MKDARRKTAVLDLKVFPARLRVFQDKFRSYPAVPAVPAVQGVMGSDAI